jgi:ubiquinone/menaquinone biosynthesis C-methylase UbiE
MILITPAWSARKSRSELEPRADFVGTSGSNAVSSIVTAMDYDKSDIAAIYDEARALTPEGLRQWLDLISTLIDRSAISLIVDLGCGTGRFSQPLAAHFATRVIAIDPSQKMLDQARQKLARGVVLLRASALALPLLDGSADMVFMSMVYHHFADPNLVAKECHRVLRDGGHVCVRNSTREADFPHRHFFPAMQPLIASELPARKDIERIFLTAGFRPAAHEIVRQVVARDWRSFVHKSSLRADSFLARLSNESFNVGMAGLRAHAAEIDPSDVVTEEIDWFVFSKQA